MRARLIFFLLSVVFFGSVIWAGVWTASDPTNFRLIVLTVVAAINTQIGFYFFSVALPGNDQQIIKRLAKVPEIESLILEAKTREEKIAVLEQQRSRLEEVIKLEVRRLTLVNRKEDLESEGIRVLHDLKIIETELTQINEHINQNSVLQRELELLNERISAQRRGDLVIEFLGQSIVIRRELQDMIPFRGGFILLIQISNDIAETLLRRRNRF